MTVSKADLKGKSCVYCSIRPATTRDHVIPKCLFLHPYPDNIHLVVAPACAYCNGAKSKDDEFLGSMGFCFTTVAYSSRKLCHQNCRDNRVWRLCSPQPSGLEMPSDTELHLVKYPRNEIISGIYHSVISWSRLFSVSRNVATVMPPSSVGGRKKATPRLVKSVKAAVTSATNSVTTTALTVKLTSGSGSGAV